MYPDGHVAGYILREVVVIGQETLQEQRCVIISTSSPPNKPFPFRITTLYELIYGYTSLPRATLTESGALATEPQETPFTIRMWPRARQTHCLRRQIPRHHL